MSRYSGRGFYPPNQPRRKVEGGLKARSARGAMATTWWATRFIEVLEQAGVGGRLQRGRTYARAGQVVTMELTAGSVTASVQGSRARPYRVRISVRAFGKAEWAQVEQALTQSAWYLARLLAGEMPEDIEDVFDAVGLSLFPAGARDLDMDCSCPDWEVPCKHLAAVLYLLAESFDEDPFRIFAWRGRTREDLLDTLHAARSDADTPQDADDGAASLAARLDSFFARQGAPAPPSPRVSPSTTLLEQLPEVDLSVRRRPLTEVLHPAYRALGDEPAT